ncbi:uncharacterized protein EV422DRAFT_571827 [Fimicolochytrium jonesii]|uniref:uncharacterized protein n=1 Tax=Fimicolochytrium jonesii TaxID=1396493 RepID=UPI0022FDE598|nr:uncharacterized protein EV422DRAFT_571827 [Fimicolochytrium jonesii]KAI8816440.1 hypothetical protein EV422DRAFT_571827 [Fimicolochytrium jonesii]
MGQRTCAIVTVSDRVSAGTAEDRSGPALAQLLTNAQWEVVERQTVPDESANIQSVVERLVENGVDLIVTTGGTGFSPRDVTPEAIAPLLERQAPGLVVAMITTSLEKTPMAALSRPVCGTKGKSVIITLPGSVKGSTENLESVLDVLPHAVDLAKGDVGAAEQTHKGMSGAEVGAESVGGHSEGGRREHHCHHHHHHHHPHHGHHHNPAHGDRPPATGAGTDDGNIPVARRPRTSQYPMVSFEDALATVVAQAPLLVAEQTFITSPNVVGSILAEDVRSREAVPNYRASIVDGYAVVVTDGPGTYPVLTASTAGTSTVPTLHPGQIARIATGAPLPPGATAVVMVEDTTLIKASADNHTEELVQIHVKQRLNDNIREIGSDVALGDLVLAKGSIITPAEIGLLTSVGEVAVRVIRKPRVAVMSTGNEVLEADAKELYYGCIRDSNRPMLLSAVAEAGFAGRDYGTVRDRTADLETSIRTALTECDVLVTTGGVSMGELDLLKPVLEKGLGAKIHFGRVMLKPGKPTTFATLTLPTDPTATPKLIFALPGNPVSASVTFYLFVLPALRKMAGYEHPYLPSVKAELSSPVTLDPARPEFHRAYLSIAVDNTATSATNSDGSPRTRTRIVAHSTGSQRSSRMLSMRGANALLKLPAGDGVLGVGEVVEGVMFRGF